ncbi:MAG: VOC family protein [Bacteroidales bacterium]
MDQRLNIITLGVKDLVLTAKFYEEIFGWKRSDGSSGDIVFYELQGMSLALYPADELAADATVNPGGNGFRRFTLAYNTRSEQEVDELIALMREKGVRVVKEPQKVFWGGYSSYIADPDENLWEIAFNPYLIPE